DVDQRHRDLLAADRQLDVRQRLAAMELEADVLHAVAGVVDENAVQGVGIEGEVVGAAVGVLQGDVVGQQGDEAAASGLIAVEHVEIGSVHRGRPADRRRLPVAGSVGGNQSKPGGQENQ